MTAAEFKTAFPVFATEQDDVVSRHITAAGPHHDVARWDDLYAEGIGLYVAHSIAVEEQEKAAGVHLSVDAVSSSGESGAMSRSAAAVEASLKNPMMRSAWGRRWLGLARVVGMGATSF